MVARARKGAGGGEGAPTAGAGGGVEVAVAYPFASEDVDLHQLYQSLSHIHWWMSSSNKDHFPALNPLS